MNYLRKMIVVAENQEIFVWRWAVPANPRVTQVQWPILPVSMFSDVSCFLNTKTFTQPEPGSRYQRKLSFLFITISLFNKKTPGSHPFPESLLSANYSCGSWRTSRRESVPLWSTVRAYISHSQSSLIRNRARFWKNAGSALGYRCNTA
jgi:hypothetical protein